MTTARQTAAALQADIDRSVPRLHDCTHGIGEALRTLDEGRVLPRDSEITVETAIACWRAVEYVRNLPGAFPERFRL
ncbi:hypothetical protein [Burkholderia multivorans]|uniref:hypothetical protein n=1 Tax=Burkholderia multivorans TaxID=87883 RepID=UPI0021BF6D7F|nr:hypothetical protein [Burkholderia multivorans]